MENKVSAATSSSVTPWPGLLEKAPWYAIYRIALGAAFLPVLSRLFGPAVSARALFISFLAVLALLRVAPALIRHIIPFSKAVQDVWFKQRMLAKRYDSYQWRKLFWIGVGMAAYLASVPQRAVPQAGLAVFCLISGALGLFCWARVRSRQLILQRAPAK
jgi:hypothetical protein